MGRPVQGRSRFWRFPRGYRQATAKRCDGSVSLPIPHRGPGRPPSSLRRFRNASPGKTSGRYVFCSPVVRTRSLPISCGRFIGPAMQPARARCQRRLLEFRILGRFRWTDDPSLVETTVTRVSSYLLGACADFGLLGRMKAGARSIKTPDHPDSGVDSRSRPAFPRGGRQRALARPRLGALWA